MVFTLGFKQLVFLLFLAVILMAGLGLGAFLMGQQNALKLANQATKPSQTVLAGEPTSIPGTVMATLPCAMTATPKQKETEEIIFTDAQATELAQQQAEQVDTAIPFEISSLFFTPGQVNLTGVVNYSVYSGEFNLTGMPYVENGQLRVKVISLTIVGQSLPGETYEVVEQELDAMFKRIFVDYDIQSVDVEEGQLRLTVIPW